MPVCGFFLCRDLLEASRAPQKDPTSTCLYINFCDFFLKDIQLGIRCLQFGIAELVKQEDLPELFIVINSAVIFFTFFLKILIVLAATARFFLL